MRETNPRKRTNHYYQGLWLIPPASFSPLPPHPHKADVRGRHKLTTIVGTIEPRDSWENKCFYFPILFFSFLTMIMIVRFVVVPWIDPWSSFQRLLLFGTRLLRGQFEKYGLLRTFYNRISHLALPWHQFSVTLHMAHPHARLSTYPPPSVCESFPKLTCRTDWRCCCNGSWVIIIHKLLKNPITTPGMVRWLAGNVSCTYFFFFSFLLW